jgi:glycosyltransferase involved in cell wall biosynthesis
MSSTVIVIPCYNEAERLNVRAFERFLHADGRSSLLFVNDGSTDGTLLLLQQIENSEPSRVEVLNLPRNRGKAEAVRTGMRLAFEHGAEYVAYWDADLATPLDAIPEFIRVLDRRPETDIVTGSRIPLLGRSIRRQPQRAFLGKLFVRAASLVLGVGLLDTQCGAKMFRSTPAIAAAFEMPFCSRWIFDVEILARIAQLAEQRHAAPLAKCLYELPLDDWEDVAGSKLRGRDFLKAPAELAHIYLRYLSPLQIRAPQIEGMTA